MKFFAPGWGPLQAVTFGGLAWAGAALAATAFHAFANFAANAKFVNAFPTPW